VLNHPNFDRLMRRLDRRVHLEDPDGDALSALPFSRKSYEPADYIVREGTSPKESALILDGLRFGRSSPAPAIGRM
jgi:hypothetical protein